MANLIAEYPYRYRGLVKSEGDLAVIRTDMGHLCGYCAFSIAEIPGSWIGSYDAPGMHFLAIHGGLTYAEREGDFTIYGFDCAHSGDSGNPALSDVEHVFELTRQMRAQLELLRDRYSEFEAADRQGKAAILDDIRANAQLKSEAGIGQMIEMLSGAPTLGAA